MENQDGDLISVTILDFGGEPYPNCTDNSTEEDLAPGDSFETCTLFFLDPGETAARVIPAHRSWQRRRLGLLERQVGLPVGSA